MVAVGTPVQSRYFEAAQILASLVMACLTRLALPTPLLNSESLHHSDVVCIIRLAGSIMSDGDWTHPQAP